MMGERVKTKLSRYTCSLYFLFLMHCTIDYAVKHCREHFHDALLGKKHSYVGPRLNLGVRKVGIHARNIFCLKDSTFSFLLACYKSIQNLHQKLISAKNCKWSFVIWLIIFFSRTKHLKNGKDDETKPRKKQTISTYSLYMHLFVLKSCKE